MQAKPNKVRHLVEQFGALPQQKELKQSKFQLETIANRVTENTNALKETLGQVDVCREVQLQPDMLQSEVTTLLGELLPQAQALKLQVNSRERQSQRVTFVLDKIAKSIQKLSKDVSQAWKAADDQLLESTRAFVELTGTYDPVAQRGLLRTLRSFENALEPSDQEGLATYRQSREALLTAMLNLNIPGEVGAFLMEALRGKGSVGKLTHPEVQKFLEEHPELSARLSVKLA
jgi:hypothetical protein